MRDELLMIFIKNPIKGKAKTRLAAGVGDEEALRIYKILLQRTNEVTKLVQADKAVHYSWFIDESDHWNDELYHKKLQVEGDLGEKMRAAFAQSFKAGRSKVIIIGSDCYQLTTEIIDQAFRALDSNDVVIGPSTDGGYYLLGMRKYISNIFNGIPWSTDQVTALTTAKLDHLKHSWIELEALTDVDSEGDLGTIAGDS